MSNTDSLKMGIYRHYKGPLYQVLGLAHDANADTLFNSQAVTEAWREGHHDQIDQIPRALGQRWVVVYLPLQLDEAHLGPRMAVRSLDDFVARVHDDGNICPPHHCGHNKARFQYLGPVLLGFMLERP